VTQDWAPTFKSRITDSIATTQQLLTDEALEAASRIADRLLVALRSGGKVFFFGNGGSATEAQHLSAEMLGRFYRDRPALPAISLSDNTAAMTAIGNDYSYEETFARQLLGLGSPGDVAIGMSTSGNSPNVVRGLEAAKGHGLVTVAMTGGHGGRIATIAHEVFRAPSDDTPRIQEAHLLIGHTICEIVENELFPAAV
jgi:D-sedoheptulose 7-phosphate isomerase